MHCGILYAQLNRKIDKSMTFDSSNYVSILIKKKAINYFPILTLNLISDKSLPRDVWPGYSPAPGPN